MLFNIIILFNISKKHRAENYYLNIGNLKLKCLGVIIGQHIWKRGRKYSSLENQNQEAVFA
jgi:hypothetical protein